jgi:uncharacterized glyoxalase superfamily protein PhnB
MSEPTDSNAPNAPTLGGVVPILRVENLAASVSYYVDNLGFESQWQAGQMASVRRGKTSIMLNERDQGQPGTWLWIGTDDVDALYADLQKRGARLRHPPTNYPWGSRECQVLDLDNHVLRFASESKPGARLGDWLDGTGRLWSPQPDGTWRLVDGL